MFLARFECYEWLYCVLLLINFSDSSWLRLLFLIFQPTVCISSGFVSVTIARSFL